MENTLSSSLSKAQVEMITRGAIKYSPVPRSRGGNNGVHSPEEARDT